MSVPMSAQDYIDHLRAEHPSTHTPWFFGSGYIKRLSVERLERLHKEAHRSEAQDRKAPKRDRGWERHIDNFPPKARAS